MAEIPDRITARGERSSWEAAAINSVCSCLLFSRGVIILPVKNQEQILRARIARKAAPENASLCNRILCFYRIQGIQDDHTDGSVALGDQSSGNIEIFHLKKRSVFVSLLTAPGLERSSA